MARRGFLLALLAASAAAQPVAAWRYHGQDCGGVTLTADGSPTIPSVCTVLWRGVAGRAQYLIEATRPDLMPFGPCAEILAAPIRVTLVPQHVDRYLLFIPLDPTLIGVRGSFQVVVMTQGVVDGATRVAEYEVGLLKSD